MFLGLMLVGAQATACTTPPHHYPYSPPRLASHWKKYASILTPGQQRVLATVLNAPDGAYAKSGPSNSDEIYGIRPVRDYLYFALPGGVLSLFFANPNYPTAEYPLNWPNCPVAGSGDCRQAVHIIGSEHIFYYPACEGGPGETPSDGQRLGPVVAGEDYKLDAIDTFTRRAYQEYGVAMPWKQTEAFWDKAAAK